MASKRVGGREDDNELTDVRNHADRVWNVTLVVSV